MFAELLLPSKYDDNDPQCETCQARKALDAALLAELESIQALMLSPLWFVASPTQSDSWKFAPYAALVSFQDKFRTAQTEYAASYAFNLAFYFMVERPERYKENRESVIAYRDYRQRVTLAQAELEQSFADLPALFAGESIPEPLRDAFKVLEGRQTASREKCTEFWRQIDAWTKTRYQKAWDFRATLSE